MKEMLLACPILIMYEYVQIMNLYAANSLSQFVAMWLYRICCTFVFRVLVDPVIFSMRRFKIKIHTWLTNKAKNDEFYEKFLSYFNVGER